MIQLPRKAISIRQPWAWLIVNGYKDIENRSWKTSFKGPILIHAGKKFDRTAYDQVKKHFSHEIDLPEPNDFEKGGIVGVTSITDYLEEHSSKWYIPGNLAWVLQKSYPLPFRPCKGQLRIYNFDPQNDYTESMELN